MSKVKHFLRKLHIGDHQHHARPPPLDTSPQRTPQSLPSTSSSPPSDIPQTNASSENERSSDGNFNYFEEEFQMQLALAISVSDQGQSSVDSETAQINAAKQISLGCLPSQNLEEILSLRYWSCNVVNYNEKVADGFYDVFGMESNLMVQAKMPSLVELQAISALDDVGFDVVLVNRATDAELRKLEERAHYISLETHTLDKALNTSFLVQKIADLIVERMGGPVSDVEEMFRRWRVRNRELRLYLNSVILPLGSLDIGHSRQRALLFKVLADRINLPCKLVKGSYYTGTDEGAVNLIKLDDGSEYIIDLMGAPGTLIPAEVPTTDHCQNFGLDARSTAGVAGTSITFENSRTCSLSSESSDSTRRGRGEIRSKQIEQVRQLKPPLGETSEASLWVGKKYSDGQNSENECTSTIGIMEPGFIGKSPSSSTRSENSASELKDWFPSRSPCDISKALERNGVVSGEEMVSQCQGDANHPSVPFSGLQLVNLPCKSENPSNVGLGRRLFKLEPEVYESTYVFPREQNVHIKDRNDEVVSFNDTILGRGHIDCSGNAEAISCSDHPDAINNVQSDPVLNGVAEILWEDLQIGERIGIGSYGEVYRAEWNGTEVAVKKFMNQDISGDALAQFKCEVEIMLRLRHPNVVLYMGAVTRPPNMSILTEFLPRGSLYKLLHRASIQIDEKRRIKMALDVAKGMNYLHTSHPVIVHRDLKTPNLLVDKNWVVKVCDFGMSRLQHHTFLSSKSTAGTAEWMAPEVLRNEPSNEKSDVYSFGVILWELATLRVPWTEMNSMQVVGAVGFQGRHLEIPPTVDPPVSEIISDCWYRNPQARPSFAQIITRLKCLQRLSVQSKSAVMF